MNELGSKLSALKNITIDMHQDVTEQDRHLDEAHNVFGGLGQTMKQSYGRMNRMVSKRHQRQLCFYVSVAVCVFFVLYFGSSVASRFSWSDQQQDPTDTTTHQEHQDI
ncbi:hypothetical protein BCR43DRAFT_498485 [Syncephalastrum racemosum]|uniref:t-SNARE coiled-coil homology domain-containing protein n=1 Tax=Syncephalastrum racemosum TaxID=13706 RepID=A0A1X2H0Z9_SYNRA|nr:hypothetical protein BCR43DRAFT_498485 [Syncephalastrum racemosum]